MRSRYQAIISPYQVFYIHVNTPPDYTFWNEEFIIMNISMSLMRSLVLFIEYDFYHFGIEEADPGVPVGRPTGTHFYVLSE